MWPNPHETADSVTFTEEILNGKLPEWKIFLCSACCPWHVNSLEILSVSMLLMKVRSRHQRCSARIGVLINYTKFAWKHLRQSLFFNKVAGLRSATLLKKRLLHRWFPVSFVKFIRTPLSQNTSGLLLLESINTLEKSWIWKNFK